MCEQSPDDEATGHLLADQDESTLEADPAQDIYSTLELLTSDQVAAMFGVDPRTVTRWANGGQLPFFTVLGGEHRYRADEVAKLYHETHRSAD